MEAIYIMNYFKVSGEWAVPYNTLSTVISCCPRLSFFLNKYSSPLRAALVLHIHKNAISNFHCKCWNLCLVLQRMLPHPLLLLKIVFCETALETHTLFVTISEWLLLTHLWQKIRQNFPNSWMPCSNSTLKLPWSSSWAFISFSLISWGWVTTMVCSC